MITYTQVLVAKFTCNKCGALWDMGATGVLSKENLTCPSCSKKLKLCSKKEIEESLKNLITPAPGEWLEVSEDVIYNKILMTRFFCDYCDSNWSVDSFNFIKQAYVTCICCAECSEIDPEINEEFKNKNEA